MLAKSATEQVIQALKKVIVEFNQNLTEQFGDNFKKLDESVQKVLEWQKRYRAQIEELHELYEHSVRKITTIEASVEQIAKNCATIPERMESLSAITTKAQHQFGELESQLAAFAQLRENVVETMSHFASLQEATKENVVQLASTSKSIQSDIQQVQDSVKAATDKMLSEMESGIHQALEKHQETAEKLGLN